MTKPDPKADVSAPPAPASVPDAPAGGEDLFEEFALPTAGENGVGEG